MWCVDQSSTSSGARGSSGTDSGPAPHFFSSNQPPLAVFRSLSQLEIHTLSPEPGKAYNYDVSSLKLTFSCRSASPCTGSIFLMAFSFPCAAELVKTSQTHHAALFTAAGADGHSLWPSQPHSFAPGKLSFRQQQLSFVVGCLQLPHKATKKEPSAAVSWFRTCGRQRPWAAAVADNSASRYHFTRLLKSLKQVRCFLMDGSISYALLPARIGSKQLASLQEDGDWHTSRAEKAKALFQAFQDHSVRPQTTHHCTSNRNGCG